MRNYLNALVVGIGLLIGAAPWLPAQQPAVIYGTYNGALKAIAASSTGSLMASVTGAVTSPEFESALIAPDGSGYTPILAGAGAGDLTNGVYTYKFTYTTAEGETAAGAATPSVTVVNAAANGQVTVRLPSTSNAAQATSLKVYRTTAGGSTYKLVVTLTAASDFGSFTYTDNIADASLGATAPTSDTSVGIRYSISGESISVPLSTYWDGYSYFFGTRDGKGVIFNAFDASTRSGDGSRFSIYAGATDAGTGGSANMYGGYSENGIGGAVTVGGGGSLATDAGDATVQGGNAGGAGTGGDANLHAGDSVSGTGGAAQVIAGDGSTDGSVLLRGLATLVKNIANNAYVYIDALGVKISGAATSGTFLKGNGTAYVASTNPAQEMSEFTTSSTGTIADLDFSNASLVRFTGGSTITLTGLLAGRDGQRVTLVAAGAGNVLLSHATGTAANRLINKVSSGPTPLAASGSGTATYVYDGTGDFWRLAEHQQGAFLTPTFSAGDYTASSSMTWTVESGDVSVNQYMVVNTALVWQTMIITSTVAGTPDTALQITIPQGYTLNGNCTTATWVVNNAVRQAALAFGSASATLISAQLIPAGNWTAVTNTAQVNFQVTCQLT